MIEIKEIYCFSDEILPSFGKNWIYLATVAIDGKTNLQEVKNSILNARFCTDEFKEADRREKWKKVDNDQYYIKNNSKVKFNELSTADKFFVAKRWLRLLKRTNFLGGQVRVKISGLNLNKVEKDNFGGKSGRETLMYSYFMEKHLKGMCSYFFNKNSDHRLHFWHDQGKQKNSTKDRLKNSERFCVENVDFIDDDHRNFEVDSEKFAAANFIQLADIFAGTTMYSFSNEDLGEKREELLDIGVNLVKEGLTYDEPSERKISTSFFPDKKWKGKDSKYNFHTDREIRRTNSAQKSLGNF